MVNGMWTNCGLGNGRGSTVSEGHWEYSWWAGHRLRKGVSGKVCPAGVINISIWGKQGSLLKSDKSRSTKLMKIPWVTKFHRPVNNRWYSSTAVSYQFLNGNIFCVCFCRSEEKIKHFSQLKSELFLKDNTLRKILCLITELKVAAQKNFILKRLFWKVGVLFLIFETCSTCLSDAV